MPNYLGDFPADATVYVYFHTFDSNDPSASVTITGLAVTDIEIYKNGSTTQRASDAGYTLLDTDGIDFDGVTGIHGFSIDTSDNTDAGFYAAGNEYTVVVSSITVDAATVNFIAATFSIERSGGALALLKNASYGLAQLVRSTTPANTLDITAGGAAGIDWGNVENPTTAVDLSGTDIQLCDTVTTLTGHTAQTGDNYARLGAPAGASVSADVAAVKAETATIVTDTNELQGDWTNGGRLDLILDQVAADLPGRITKNTALNNFEFLMVDSTDHVTAKTGLTVTVQRSIDGAAFGNATNTPATEVANGIYKINLSAADLNGDVVTLRCTATNADDRLITIVTQAT